jgi:hypothetical protein
MVRDSVMGQYPIDNFRNKISPTTRWGSNKQITIMYLIVVNPSWAWAISISKVVYYGPGGSTLVVGNYYFHKVVNFMKNL